jgi:hypothetical protein
MPEVTFNRRAYVALTIANLKVYLRNPLAASSVFLALMILLVVLHTVNFSESAKVRIGVVDGAKNTAASRLMAELGQYSAFQITALAPDSPAATSALDQNKSDLVIAIPPEFGTRDASGHLRQATLTVRYHDGSPGQGALPTIQLAIAGLNQELLSEPPPVLVDAAPIEPPSTASEPAGNYFLPGILAFNLVQSGLLLATGVFAGYKSSGVLRRVKATGIDATSFVLAHATASFILGLIQSILILIVSSVLYSLSLNIVALLLVTVLGYLIFLALGFAVSGLVRDPQRAPMIAGAIGTPMIFVGLFPATIFPKVAQPVIHYLPVTFVTDALGQINRGASLLDLRADLLALVIWAAIGLLGATRSFRWD